MKKDIENLKIELKEAITRWKKLRDEDPQFWGEDHDVASEVMGWGKYLDITTKITLVKLQIRSDLGVHSSYEDWENR
jgi:hypothetical protein|tara:strand:+ start:342 stop:572 length:231 start_codon:yes stop_codon:yes gene_type:complete